MDNTKPLVTVWCPAYNQEKYIGKAIESFLMQKTNFPFEIIIHDDASTDNTAKIINEYQKKYPEFIKPILQTSNQFSKDKSHLARTMPKVARGKYVAFCEGDDFWTDENKLQEQVDILEKNEGVSLCYHNISVLDERKTKTSYGFYGTPKQNATTIDIIKNHFVPTHSIVFRNVVDFSKYAKEISKMRSIDIFIELLLSLHGTFYHIDKEMAVYRFQDNSFTSSSRDNFRWVESSVFLYKTFNIISQRKFEKETSEKIVQLLKEEGNYIKEYEKGFEYLKRTFQNYLHAFKFLPFSWALRYMKSILLSYLKTSFHKKPKKVSTA